MLAAFRRPRPVAEPAAAEPEAPATRGDALILDISREASGLGRDAAEVRGTIDDAVKAAAAQAQALQALTQQLSEITRSQDSIAAETRSGGEAMNRAREAVEAVGLEVSGIVQTLREVSGAAGQITQIALQTRLVAFNASVEAKRAGEAGRGFGVVADAVKDLAAKVEQSSKQIAGTVAQLDQRVQVLAREIQRQSDGAQQGAVHRALADLMQGVQRIGAAAEGSHTLSGGIGRRAVELEGEMRHTTQTLSATLQRTEAFLRVSERLIEVTAACGIETADTPFIQAVQGAAVQVAELLEHALQHGAITRDDLFDENYLAVQGSAPQQHMTRFVVLAERLFPQVQEAMLQFHPQVVYCIASDRNGYIACHNQKYNNPQRAGDLAWNAANCRNRRIFNDRTGLASSRNSKPFLLQTYRRDMGGGQFVLLKEAAAPIVVGGRHWGGLRLAYRF